MRRKGLRLNLTLPAVVVGAVAQGRLPKLSKGSLSIESPEAGFHGNLRRDKRGNSGHQTVFLPTNETWNWQK